MTNPVDAPDASEDTPGRSLDGVAAEPAERPRPVAHLSVPELVASICPYLVSAGGSWRSATPSRDHRCGAVEPIAPLTTDKQRRHCLGAEHGACRTFWAARAGRAAMLAPGVDPAHVAAADAARRPLARTAPLVLEPPRLIDQAVRLQFERAPGQLVLIALMILAFLVVAVARLSAGGASSPGANAASSASASARPSPSPSPTSTQAPGSSGSASASSSAGSVGSNLPPVDSSFRTTYTVLKNDTLAGIATKFGTTAAAVSRLNNLKSSKIFVGQVLKVP